MKAQSGTGALSLIVYRGDCMKKFKDNVQAYLFLCPFIILSLIFMIWCVRRPGGAGIPQAMVH